MKIGIEAQRIFREKKHGMDFVALEMIRSLQQIDQHNEYVIFVNEGPDECLQETSNFSIVRHSAAYPIWEQVWLPKMARELHCDILHCTSNTAPLRCAVPLVVTIHDIIYFENFPLLAQGYSWYQRLGNMYRRIVVSQNLKQVKSIITVSEFEKKRFLDFLKLKESQVEVVYNGVSKHFQPIEDVEMLKIVRKKYDLPARYVLFLGNTDPKKNTENTIVAFAKYCKDFGRDHHLVVADLDPGMIKDLLKDEGLEEFFSQIIFTGYISNYDLPAVLTMAEVFLYPSKRESFGIPILEAMACGIPVITSEAASMPEVAGGAAILVDPNQSDDICAALGRILNDAELRDELRVKGLKRAKHFSWENTAQGVLNIYERYKTQA